MKKSLVALLLTLGMLLPLQACSFGAVDSSSGSGSSIDSILPNAETVTITFRQKGCNDVVKKVKKGETLTDIPFPQTKTGYTVVWDRTDFSNMTENIVVEAEETANTYTVTYDAVGGTASVSTQNIEYDSEPTLATATRDGYEFKGWEYNGTQVLSGAKWTIAQDVTLTAVWAKTYTVVLDSNRGKLPGNQTTITVTYGEAYELPTPTSSDYVFSGWMYNGQTIDLEGIWNIQSDGEIKLVADWYSEWTKAY